MIVQKLKAPTGSPLVVASKYYSIISAVNSLKLTPREIQLISFAATNGSLSQINVRESFCEEYGTTLATINNMISKLKKKKVLVKDDGDIEVNPVILLDFEKDIKIEVVFIKNG